MSAENFHDEQVVGDEHTAWEHENGILPTITLSGELREDVRDAWRVIHDANVPPKLFRFGGVPARVEFDDQGCARVRPVERDGMRLFLGEAANWRRSISSKSGPTETKTAPPDVVVRSVLATPDMVLPILSSVVASPIFAANGVLETEPGYHAESRTYFAPAEGFSMPPVADHPTTQDITAARTTIMDDLLGDFPFASEADRANAVALLLLPFARELISGPTPLHLVEKPAPGTGATLLVDVLTYPATGGPISTMTEGNDEDEWRKRITAKLLTASLFLLIDNLRRRLESSAVASAITSPTWEDRLLGTSTIVNVPVRCGWIATGNNPIVSNEIARRTIRIRMDAKLDQPWRRDGFRHPDLRGWVQEHRGRLVWSALTLIRAWLVAGRPDGSERLGMFESWSTTLGGILDVAGIPGFLTNLDEFYEAADAEGSEWREFVAAWWHNYQNDEVKSKDLYSLAMDSSLTIQGKTEQGMKVRFGNMLHNARDRVFTLEDMTVCIKLAGERQRSKTYFLEVQSISPRSSAPGESGESSESQTPGIGEVNNPHIDKEEKTHKTHQTHFDDDVPF